MLFLIYINYRTNMKIKNWHIISYTVDTAVGNAENLFPKRQEKHYKSPARGCRARAVRGRGCTLTVSASTTCTMSERCQSPSNTLLQYWPGRRAPAASTRVAPGPLL